jgi:hypothetical protein
MNITISMSGGFAGLQNKRLKAIETGRLDKQTAANIEKCIDTLAGLIVARAEAPMGADMLQYEIDVEHDDGRRQLMIFTDEDRLTHPALEELLTLAYHTAPP